MKKVILFDIDKTLFDRESFLNDFYLLLSSEFDLSDVDVIEVKKNYDDVKSGFGYFSFKEFIKKIYKTYPMTKDGLDYYFENKNIERYIFEDASIIYKIKDFDIGIFSKGDNEFQKIKIDKFIDIFDNNLLFVYHNKIKKIPEVIKKIKNDHLFIVDDDIEVLKEFKIVKKDVKTILIDRGNMYKKELVDVDFRINTLFDIISILK